MILHMSKFRRRLDELRLSFVMFSLLKVDPLRQSKGFGRRLGDLRLRLGELRLRLGEFRVRLGDLRLRLDELRLRLDELRLRLVELRLSFVMFSLLKVDPRCQSKVIGRRLGELRLRLGELRVRLGELRLRLGELRVRLDALRLCLSLKTVDPVRQNKVISSDLPELNFLMFEPVLHIHEFVEKCLEKSLI